MNLLLKLGCYAFEFKMSLSCDSEISLYITISVILSIFLQHIRVNGILLLYLRLAP
jgi:hypothetical protein